MRLTVQQRHFQRMYGLDVSLLFFIACGMSLSWAWVLMCVFAPLCEEVIFRWGLQEGLLRRRWGYWQANVATALIFAVAHGVLRSWALAVWVAVPALFLGWVYQRSRPQGAKVAVRHCVLWHSGFNAMYLGFTSGLAI